jgi:hypothetical protein
VNIECVERQGTRLTHPEAAGGCGARVGGRGWADQGGDDGTGARRWRDELRKVENIFDFLFAFGRLVFVFGG